MATQPELIQALGDLSTALASIKARWYLFGAQAVAVYGTPRMSADVDATIEIDFEDLAAALRAFETAGFRSRVGSPESFAQRTRVLPLVHATSGLPFDLVLAGPGLEMGFLDRATITTLGDISVPIIDPTDLIISKVLAGRPKDIEDVKGIVSVQASRIEGGRALATLRELDVALDRDDLEASLLELLD